MLPTKRLIAALGMSLIAGCASTSSTPSGVVDGGAVWLSQREDCCQGLDTLPVTPLAPHGDIDLTFSSDTLVHVFESGKSPFRALKLPRRAGPLKLSWTSEVRHDDQGNFSLFAPVLLVLDEQGDVQRRFDWEDFSYQPAQGLSTDRLVLSFGVTPGADADRVVVLTSDTARAGTTELLHPARAYARARNLVEPAIKNPLAAHRAIGTVELRVRPLGEADGLFTSWVGRTQQSERSVAPSSTRVEPATIGDTLEGIDYRRMVRAALKADDIALAMQLAERAEHAGEHGVRQWLAEQLQQR